MRILFASVPRIAVEADAGRKTWDARAYCTCCKMEGARVQRGERAVNALSWCAPAR